MIIPAPQNEDYGFFGTIGLHHAPQEFWKLAVSEICKATREHAEDVALFLDSRHGRHFADDVLNGLHNGLSRQEAVTAETGKWSRMDFRSPPCPGNRPAANHTIPARPDCGFGRPVR
ncbi:hypothetical protein [Neisseria musculi]|uniref:Uncharacterized protein n=1 Tax=Neisseria musculi TaxID=1815583 RepID=A0A7H1MC80_9NEIS|nr:hypothetical protein [Neisseria musculi]QNT59245.1 hypothetical protein H7A79_0910 [Neisseria musculi]